jgi:hypothetical protein
MAEQSADSVRRDHTFRSPQVGIQTFCAYCLGSDTNHRPVTAEVRKAAEVLRREWPGWFVDGGGIMALQDSERTAFRMLEAATHNDRSERTDG